MAKFAQVVQAWVPPSMLSWALANIANHMVNDSMTKITHFELVDDRGGDGHFQIRFDEEETTLAVVRKFIGKGIDVSMEDK